MTQKEKLYREMVSINNEVANLYGEFNVSSTIREIDLEHELRIHTYRDYKVEELKCRIDYLNKKKEEAIKDKQLRDFYETEEGKKIYESFESERERLIKERENNYNHYKEFLEIKLKEICGEGFGITSMGRANIEIAKLNKEGKPIFGHNWSVNQNWYGNKEYTINYPTLGSFNPEEALDRVIYLTGLAKFSDPKNFKMFISAFELFINAENENEKSFRKLEEKMKNPYEVKVA